MLVLIRRIFSFLQFNSSTRRVSFRRFFFDLAMTCLQLLIVVLKCFSCCNHSFWSCSNIKYSTELLCACECEGISFYGGSG